MNGKTGFLEEAPGQRSSYRLIMIVFFVTVCAGWLYVAVATKTVPEIPYGLAGLGAAVLVGKNWQKKNEEKAPPGSPGGGG